MRIIFVRHGERRRGERDPELTSAGRRMARETGLWIQERNQDWAAGGGAPVSQVVHTPTARTRQTADEITMVLDPPPVTVVHAAEPYEVSAWQHLIRTLQGPEGSVATMLLVGHHPTVDFLLRAFGPAPITVPLHHLASALVLESPDGDAWTITAAWPGRFA